MGKNNRQKTERVDKHMRRAVRFHTADVIFAARLVIDKHREMQVFIDLEKAYDRVPRQVFEGAGCS